jgi:hypothetical protein
MITMTSMTTTPVAPYTPAFWPPSPHESSKSVSSGTPFRVRTGREWGLAGKVSATARSSGSKRRRRERWRGAGVLSAVAGMFYCTKGVAPRVECEPATHWLTPVPIGPTTAAQIPKNLPPGCVTGRGGAPGPIPTSTWSRRRRRRDLGEHPPRFKGDEPHGSPRPRTRSCRHWLPSLRCGARPVGLNEGVTLKKTMRVRMAHETA